MKTTMLLPESASTASSTISNQPTGSIAKRRRPPVTGRRADLSEADLCIGQRSQMSLREPAQHLTGRELAERFEFSACVDWVKLRVRTAQKTQGKHLARRIGNAKAKFAKPLDDSGKWFEIMFHDPENADEIAVALLREEVGILPQPQIVAMEVSIDAYPRGAFDLEQAQDLAFEAVCSIGDHKKPNRVQIPYGGKGITIFSPNSKEVREGLDWLGTVYQGDQEKDPVAWRTYIKIKDRNRSLRSDYWRVRHEITIIDPLHLPGGLEEFRNWRFEQLAKLMPVYREVEVTGRNAWAMKRPIQSLRETIPSMSRRNPISRRRNKSRHLKRDTALYQLKVYGPLRRLSKQWASPCCLPAKISHR